MKRKTLLSVISSEWVLRFLFLAFAILALLFFSSINNLSEKTWGLWGSIFYVKASIEIIASGYVVFYIFVAFSYSKPSLDYQIHSSRKQYPNIAIAYFCCDDVDLKALDSIVECCVRYQAVLLIHDDSSSVENRISLDNVVASIEEKRSLDIRIIRRPRREGGKPGAINNLMLYLHPDIEYMLICDSDSYLPNDSFLEQAFSYFSSPEVGLVQFRNVGKVLPQDSRGYSVLSASVDFYDAFVSVMDRFGWSPFLGHNAILRVSAINDVGGFTNGQFADDIDYSVKLRLHGYRIRYAREIVAGERHPLTYSSLRKRTQKWAYGCTQILLRWALPILRSRKLTILDKITFFLTVGYYHFQILLLAYLAVFYVCLPFQDSGMKEGDLFISAALILFFTFMPSIIYFARNGDFFSWPKAAVYWGLTYGSQDFVILKAVIRCLIKRHLKWVPTNEVTGNLAPIRFLQELLFGSLIVCVAVFQYPTLLLLPTTVLFAGKFLISPYLGKLVFHEASNQSERDSGSFLEEQT